MSGRLLFLSATLAALFLPPSLTAQERTTVGGYGEIHYHNPTSPDGPAKVNLKRFVLYLAHSFDERLSFRSELEVEDAKVEGGEAGGEVALEQAFLDYRLSDVFTLRSGLVLVPVGILNETHEPPTFNGVERPLFDQELIHTTWREIGVGATGSLPSEGLSYRVYLVNGLRAAGFTADEGIHEGSGEGKEASFANPSLTGRLEWARPGLRIGGSFWYGGTADGTPELGTGAFAAPITVLSADVRYDRGALSLRGEAANISLPDAGAIDRVFGSEVASRMTGGWAEAAYDLLSVLAPDAGGSLDAFIRHERYDLQAHVPAAVTRDRALARRVTTLGLTFEPTYNTAFKADYQLLRTASGDQERDVFSLGVGYSF